LLDLLLLSAFGLTGWATAAGLWLRQDRTTERERRCEEEAAHYRRVRDRLDWFGRVSAALDARDAARLELRRTRAGLALAEAVAADAVAQFQTAERWRRQLAAVCLRVGIAMPEDLAEDPTEAAGLDVSADTPREAA